MKIRIISALALALCPVLALAEGDELKVSVKGIADGGAIPDQFAFCNPHPTKRSVDGENINPEISWSPGPEGTASYAIIVHDTDVPTVFDDANQEGKTLPANMSRMNFFHWVLVDIPVKRNRIAQGEDSKELLKAGKPVGKRKYGVNGHNDFASFMEGEFGGYDGPCPPWNDEALHHYHFTVYALDVPTLGLSGNFGGIEAMAAMEGHVLASGSITGTYTQNLRLTGVHTE